MKCRSAKFITLLRLLMLPTVMFLFAGCASNNEHSDEMEAHFAEMEAQQLRELESDEEARKLAMRRPPKPVSEFELQEDEKNQRYRKALAAASKRGLDNLVEPALELPTLIQPTDASPGAVWQLTNTLHPLSGVSICAIQSAQSNIDNGGIETQVRVIVTPDTIFLRTDATLDEQASIAGMQVDDGPLFAIESYANEVTGVIEDQYRSLLIQIALGGRLKILFRYKPQAIDAEAHQLELDVSGFAGYLEGLKNC